MTSSRRTFFTVVARAVAVLFALSSSLAFADQQRLALVIGNADYPDLGAPLQVALKSARAVSEQLQTAGFDVEAHENTRQGLAAAIAAAVL